jgi:outer membrane protein OmpA-like peptidoglycan-associated protein
MVKRFVAILLSFALLICLFSCAGQTRQQRGATTGVLIGAATGAVLGQVIGRDTEATLIGTGIGAAIGGLGGHQIGAYMDRQEQELRSAIAASEAASIYRNQDVLTATFKSDVFFDFDSFTLKPGAHTEIARVAEVLSRYPQTTIRVEGHTDATGPETYNQQLSERRAEAVANALVQRGVDRRRVYTVGFGESQPISSSNAANRRVNIVIMPVVS